LKTSILLSVALGLSDVCFSHASTPTESDELDKKRERIDTADDNISTDSEPQKWYFAGTFKQLHDSHQRKLLKQASDGDVLTNIKPPFKIRFKTNQFLGDE